MPQHNVNLSDKTMDALRRIAREKGVPMAKLTEMALGLFVSDDVSAKFLPPSSFDHAKIHAADVARLPMEIRRPTFAGGLLSYIIFKGITLFDERGMKEFHYYFPDYSEARKSVLRVLGRAWDEIEPVQRDPKSVVDRDATMKELGYFVEFEWQRAFVTFWLRGDFLDPPDATESAYDRLRAAVRFLAECLWKEYLSSKVRRHQAEGTPESLVTRGRYVAADLGNWWKRDRGIPEIVVQGPDLTK